MANIRQVKVNWVGTPVFGGGISLFHFFGTVGSPSSNVNAVNTLLTTVAAQISSALAWSTDATVLVIDEASGAVVSSSGVTSVGGVGTGAGDPLPQAAQGLLQLKTGVYVGRRELRGRLFLPGATESSNTNGAPVAAYITAWNGAAATLVASATDEWMVYSRKNHISYPVMSAVTWGKWASLRKRRD